MTIADYIRRNRLPDGRMPMNWQAHYAMLKARAQQQQKETPR